MATWRSYLYYCHDDLVINNVHSTEVPPPHGEKTHMQLLWLKEGFSETRLGPATIPCRAAVGPRAIVLCTSALERASSPMVHYVFLAGWRHWSAATPSPPHWARVHVCKLTVCKHTKPGRGFNGFTPGRLLCTHSAITAAFFLSASAVTRTIYKSLYLRLNSLACQLWRQISS